MQARRHPIRIGLLKPRSGAAAILVAGVMFAVGVTNLKTQSVAPVQFRLAVGAVDPDDAPKTLINLLTTGPPTVLHSGDLVKLYLVPQTASYIYMLFESAQQELTLLFPAAARLDAPATAGSATYIPAGTGWLELDKNPGLETVHVIASSTPLPSLTALLRASEAAVPAQKVAASASALEEIRRLKRERMMARVAERPITIAGQTRGVARLPDVATIATEISAGDFYTRTVEIDHR